MSQRSYRQVQLIGPLGRCSGDAEPFYTYIHIITPPEWRLKSSQGTIFLLVRGQADRFNSQFITGLRPIHPLRPFLFPSWGCDSQPHDGMSMVLSNIHRASSRKTSISSGAFKFAKASPWKFVVIIIAGRSNGVFRQTRSRGLTILEGRV